VVSSWPFGLRVTATLKFATALPDVANRSSGSRPIRPTMYTWFILLVPSLEVVLVGLLLFGSGA
jgi:hypothetical protein